MPVYMVISADFHVLLCPVRSSLPAIRSLERKARYLFYFCCFVHFFVNDFSTTRGPIHTKFCMRAYSGSECVFSPFGGWRPTAGGKRGKWNFCYYGSQWGISAFWRFLSDISATLARIHTKYYLCITMSADVPPPPLVPIDPQGVGGGGVKTQKIGGWSHSCIGQLPFLFFSAMPNVVQYVRHRPARILV